MIGSSLGLVHDEILGRLLRDSLGALYPGGGVCVTRTRLVSKVFDVNPSHSKDRPLKWEINSIKVDLPNKECLKAKK